MLINPKSWHYRLYRFSYNLWSDYVPLKTNLCQYMRRLMFTPFMAAWWLFMHVIAIVFYSIVGFTSLFVGYYPTFNFDAGEDTFKQYPLPKIGNARIVPGHIILAAIFVSIHYTAFVHHFWLPFIVEGMLVGTVLLVVGCFTVSGLMEDSKYPSVIKEYVLAKKSRFCPTVEFDHPTVTKVEAPVVPIDKQT